MENNEEQDDLAAVEEALLEWQAGDEGTPIDEAFDAIRRKYRQGDAEQQTLAIPPEE